MSSNSFPPQGNTVQAQDTQQAGSADVVQETVQTGPLTGRDVSAQDVSDNAQQQVRSARSSNSGRRSRKSASAFRTISEVADALDVQQHVLRFWETKFSQVRPLKRGGGRRYYRPEDLALLQKIHHLLYTEGYTIKGVQKLLREQGKKALLDGGAAPREDAAPANAGAADAPVSTQSAYESLNAKQRALMESVLGDLKDLRKIVSAD